MFVEGDGTRYCKLRGPEDNGVLVRTRPSIRCDELGWNAAVMTVRRAMLSSTYEGCQPVLSAALAHQLLCSQSMQCYYTMAKT